MLPSRETLAGYVPSRETLASYVPSRETLAGYVPTKKQVAGGVVLLGLLTGSQYGIATHVADAKLAQLGNRRFGPPGTATRSRAERCVDLLMNDGAQRTELNDARRVFNFKEGACTPEGEEAARRGAAVLTSMAAERDNAKQLECVGGVMGDPFAQPPSYRVWEDMNNRRIPADTLPAIAEEQRASNHARIGNIARYQLPQEIEWRESMAKHVPAGSETEQVLHDEIGTIDAELKYFDGAREPRNCTARANGEVPGYGKNAPYLGMMMNGGIGFDMGAASSANR